MAIINLETGEEDINKIATQPIATQGVTVPQASNSGIIDLSTGEFVSAGQQEQAVDGKVGFLDTFTGSDRIANNPELGTLPEFGSTEQGDTFKIAAGLLSTANPVEQQDIIKSIIPESEFESLSDGSVIVNVPGENGVMQRSVLNRPGISPQDLTTGIAQVLAFVPAAKMASFGKNLLAKVGIGAFASAATEAARQEATIAQGSEQERSPSDVAITGVLGGLSETILPAVQSIRSARRARAIGAETDEVANAIKSIKPTREAQEGLSEATGVDVPLFQAQQTQIPSELLKQRVLPQLDAGARTAAKALESQNKAAFDATSELINTIAPEGSVVSASQRFKDAAQESIQIVKRARSEQASPIYKQAFRRERQGKNPSIKTNALQVKIDEMAKQFDPEDQIAKSLLKTSEKIKSASGSIQKLHNAKIEIDQMIAGTASDSLGNTTKRFLTDVQGDLVEQMTKQSPSYRAARDEFIRLSPQIESIANSVIGKVSEFSDTQLKNVAQTIFDPKAGLTDPQSILNAKKLIDDVDPEAWQQLLRVEMNRRIGGLEQLIEDIPGDFAGNIPGQLRRTLFGNPQQRKALMMAMNDEQKTNFKYLETVLKRASSGRAAGSPTAAFGQAIEKLKGISVVIRDAVFKPLSTLQQTGERGIFDKNVSRLAEVMFDPKFKPQLKRLRKLNQDSPAAARAMAQLMNNNTETQQKEQ